MAHQSSRIYIPEPCHEDWNNMTPKEKGRFCDSCSKVVVDFTKMSTQDIQDYMKSQQGNRVCGHFKKSQLDLPPVTITLNEEIYRLPMTKKFLLAAFLVFGFTLFSCAQTTKGDVKMVGKVAVAPVQIQVEEDTVASYLTTDTLEFINGQLTGIEPVDNNQPDLREFPLGDVAFVPDTEETAITPDTIEDILIDGEIEYIPDEIDVTEIPDVIEIPPVNEEVPDNSPVIKGNVISEPEPVSFTRGLVVRDPAENAKPVEKEPVSCVEYADQMPQFPGGQEALAKYMNGAVKYTKDAQEQKIEGTVYVKFTVTKTGVIKDVKPQNDIGYGLDDQAYKAISQMPKWVPGAHEGKPVDVELTLPINFRLK